MQGMQEPVLTWGKAFPKEGGWRQEEAVRGRESRSVKPGIPAQSARASACGPGLSGWVTCVMLWGWWGQAGSGLGSGREG